jgi:DNA-binding NarL/FixJ family response regulator
MTPLRILLADDHALVRAGFRALLEGLGMEVVAEAGDGDQALRLIGSHRPDIVLMDIAMAGLSGLEATRRAVEEFPGVRVIILSMHANAEYARRAVRAGAAGYLLKDASTAELEIALDAVARGQTYLSPVVATHLLADYARTVLQRVDAPEQLAPRLREVLQLIAQGYPRREIARKLNISPKTFDTYRGQLMEQLDIHDTAGLVRYAARMGLIAPDEQGDSV